MNPVDRSDQTQLQVGAGSFHFADAVPMLIVVPMLLWALLPDNPYAYYRLLRWICCPCFAYLAVTAYQRGFSGWIWILGGTAMIYNPIIPVHLNRGLWTPINIASIVIAAAGTWVLWQSAKRRVRADDGAIHE